MEAALHAGSLLAAGLPQPLSENSRPGHPLSTVALYPGIGFVNSNTATGLRVCLYDDRRRSRNTGKERDSESGLDYFGARYYGSALGRFTSVDRIMINDERLTDPHLYAYARNNPLKFIDPNGDDIVENIDKKYRKHYEQWKSQLLSTKEGQRLWNKFADDKNFTVAISVSKGQDNGAVTTPVVQNGGITGANIVLGNNIGDAHPPTDSGYLVTGTLQGAGVDSKVIGGDVFAHELGHVEDYTQAPTWFLYLNDYNKDVNAAPDAASVVNLMNQYFGGQQGYEYAGRANEWQAEQRASSYIQQKLGGNTPKPVQRGIDRLRSVSGGN
jgi:RHS repeat-associated protein